MLCASVDYLSLIRIPGLFLSFFFSFFSFFNVYMSRFYFDKIKIGGECNCIAWHDMIKIATFNPLQ
jgi:hypothetical protein